MKNVSIFLKSICLLITVWPILGLGSESVDSWASVRALGMGNAYTAVVSDGDALFYNPAGLGKAGGFDWTIFDPRIGLDGLTVLQALQDYQSSSNFVTFLNNLYGKHIWLGAGAKSVLRVSSLAAAIYTSADASIDLSNPAYPYMNLNYFADLGYAAGGAIPFIPQVFYLGMTARRITRTGTNLPLGPSSLATLTNSAIQAQLANRGVGYGLDLGLVLTLPSPIKPTLSFTWRNAGVTQFTLESGTTAPDRIMDEMILGAALEIDVPLITITPSFDYRHFNDPSMQLGKKLHMGVEIDLPLIDIRAGLHQGYYTLGAGLSLGLIRFDAATYGVELGEYPGQKEDRRYIAQMTLEIGFDSSLFGGSGGADGKGGAGSGSGGSGAGRKLKLRR